MAESSSNSSTTSSAAGAAGAGVGAGVGSTSGNGNGGAGSTSTSGKGSSTGKSGSTGSGSSGLTFTGLTFSDGKFSAPSGKGSTENSTSTKGVTLGSVGTGLGLDGSIGEGIGLTTGANGKSTTTAVAEPVMTVDEVYGKGNQSIVEAQGDYEAVSNEKSNVETQTFGKQDEISVTPVSITENKGEVDNAAIQSVEGLDFQQKDKVAQEVMDAKKARDDAEAEDESDKAREQLAANEAEAEDNEEITFDFKVGDRDEDLAAVQKELEQASKAKNDLTAKAQKSDEALNAAEENVSKIEASHEEMKSKVEAGKKAIGELVSEAKNMVDGKGFIEKAVVEHSKEFSDLKGKISKVAESYGIDVGDISKAKSDDLVTAVNVVAEVVNKSLDNALEKSEENVAKVKQQRDEVAKRNAELRSKAVEAEKSVEALRTKYNDITKSKFEEAPIETYVGEEADSNKSNAEVSFEAARDEINNADIAEETKSKAIETINNVEAATKSVNDAADALAANPNDPAAIEAYVNAVKTYNENVENALKGNPLAKTDLNKTFTEMVAKANDFDVTMPDGTKVSYAEFAAEKAVESPALAKGLYEAKAKALADEGHTVLAAIENAKAKMVTTWLGSKFTFADNQVRSQFNQMAKTDMRATYATYNNVLSDETGKYSEADKAEASAAINQANALMTASAALQASTGFFSGMGDSMKDGVYGVTDPNALTVSQKTMNTISNFAKVVLGLGVTPGANKAYQNMYYLAGEKVNKSNLFNKDFDGDGFALCQEYGNNAAAGMIAGVGELATGIALFFNPATASMGLNLAMESVQTLLDGLYGVQREAKKSVEYSSEIVGYLNEAKDIAAEAGEKEETVSTTGVTIDRVIDSAISQIENFELKSGEANNLDNWLEGSGSATTGNEKFNQSLTYDEWLKLIEADPTMQEYAKKLIAEKA